MTSPTKTASDSAVQHAGEGPSNDVRRRLAEVEPLAQRTVTPSMAVLAKSSGSYHWTPEGRKLADFTSGVLVANLGHNPTRWWKRVTEYLGLAPREQDGEFLESLPLTAYNAVTELEVRAAERLVANLRSEPGGGRMEQILWAASGSEAIQKALWAAMSRRKGADMILATRGGFHGKKGLAGAVTGNETDYDRDHRVRFIGFPTDECNNLELRRQAIDLSPYEAELTAIHHELGSRICCVISEPYLGAAGSFHPQKEYFAFLERFCRERDILLVLDEIQSNFGRTGPMYAFTHYGIEPDIVCLGKDMGNGVPVSAVAGGADVLGGLAYGEGSDTWSANPLSCAAVLATLDEFESYGVLEHAVQLAKVIEEGLSRLVELDVVAHIRGEGLVWGVECAAAGGQGADAVAAACIEACYLGDASGRAIHLLGPLAGNVLRVSPPLVMPLAEARQYLDVMYAIFASLSARLAGS